MEVCILFAWEFDSNELTLEVKLDIIEAKNGMGGNLCFKIQTVVNGNLVDMDEAVQQALAQMHQIDKPSSVATDASGVLETADHFAQGVASFYDTWGPVLDKLSFIQTLGDAFSEVSHLHSYLYPYLNEHRFIHMLN